MKIVSFIRSVALGLGLLSAAALPAACSGEAPAQSAAHQSVTKVVADFNAAWTAQDYPTMLSLSLPPQILDQIMVQYGVTPGDGNREQLADEIKSMMAMALSQAKVIETKMDAADAKVETSPTGRSYALVPSVVEIEAAGQRIRSTGQYLAFEDAGRWYLMDASGADALAALKVAFPDLADVPMAPSKMETVSP